MKRIIFLLSILNIIHPNQIIAQSNAAADLYKLKCSICHTIGKGKLVGPDLNNVHQRQTHEWLVNFIRSSQKVVNSGDAYAVALFEEYNKLLMPDPMISDNEIVSILNYIAEQSGEGGGVAAYVSILDNATPEDFENGKRLFDGRAALAKGGPACIACHNGLTNTFFNDKSYAKDLSTSFATLGEAGVRAILENPPFPVMTKAFAGRNLEPKEVHDLLFYMKNAEVKNAGKAGVSLPSGFMLYGLLGSLALMVLYSGLWYSRKSKSVNHAIYKRQIKSFN